MESLLNVKQAAFILKVHPLTIRRYIKEGHLKAVRAGGNIRIKESDLLEFNKVFTPKEKEVTQSNFKKKSYKTFSEDDPFLRLKGRGVSLQLST